MLPSFSTSFDETSTELGSADNQPVPRTYQIVPMDSASWFTEIPIHSHVFIKPTSRVGALASEVEAHAHHPYSQTYYALTPVQLNAHLQALAAEGKYEHPYQVADDWHYVGINMTPSPDPDTRNTKIKPNQRFITCQFRTAEKMDNHWYDAKGTDELSFVFKHVHPSVIPAQYITGKAGEARASKPGGSGHYIQLVAMRSPTRLLSDEALMTVPGEVSTSDKRYDAMGVHIPVGIMARNLYVSEQVRDDDKWAKEGCVCADSGKAAREHVDPLVFVS